MALPSSGKITARVPPPAVDPSLTGGNFVNPNLTITGGQPYIVFVNDDVVPWTIVLTLKAGGGLLTYTMNPGKVDSWATAPYSSVQAALPTGGTATAFQWYYSPVLVTNSPIGSSYGGEQTIELAQVVDAGDNANIYFCPAGFKFRLLKLRLNGTSGEVFSLQLTNSGGNVLRDYAVSQAFAAKATYEFAEDSLADVVLYDDVLLPGDTLKLSAGVDAVGYSFEGVQSPL